MSIISLACLSRFKAKQIFALTFLIFLSPFTLAQTMQFSGQLDSLALTLNTTESVQLNKIYSWNATIKQSASVSSQTKINLSTLKPSDIRIQGGMPSHGHGLPTQPIVSKILRAQENQISFEIQGLKFQMWGEWVIKIKLPSLATPIESHFKLTP
jgi:hypothetical protein